jgi:hypothetical protein
MKPRILWFFLITASILLAACGGAEPAPEATGIPVTPTPDLCSAENLPAEVAKINKLMREFDDYSVLASNTPQSQLVLVIPELQRILRDAEDLSVPPCLNTLKELQIAHMTTVVQTLIAFMSNPESSVINAGVAQAREQHLQYDLEMARLLGFTLIAPTGTPAPGLPAEQPTPAPAATSAPFVLNPGPTSLNLRSAPDLGASQTGLLGIQESAPALGRTPDNQWILLEIPNQPGVQAWVYAPLVQLSVPIEQLPVVNP